MLPSEHELSRLLDTLYDAATDPTLWQHFIGQLGGHTRATGGVLVIHNLEHASCTVATSWGIDPEMDLLYQGHYHALDPWAQRASVLSVACHSESVCPIQEIRKTEFYNDFLLKAGIEHAIFGVMENSDLCLASVSLYRDRCRPEFTDSDLRILRFLAPHLRRAFKLHFRLSVLRAQSAGVESALDLLPIGVILLHPSGAIVHLNRSATALVAENDGLLATHVGLRAQLPTESALLTETIRKAISNSNGKGVSAGTTVLVSRRGRPPLQIQISPIHNSIVKTSQRVAAIVFVNDPLRPHRPNQGLLRMRYGLTPAECRVALLLSDGHPPRRIAEIVGVTDNTVRSQIKSIFSKTGVGRQSEMIRLLMASADPILTRS